MTETATIPGTMPDIRQAVKKELKARGWTAYRLTQAVAGKVKPGTVYGFLRDEKPTEMNSRNLGHVFDALGWKLPPAGQKPSGRRSS